LGHALKGDIGSLASPLSFYFAFQSPWGEKLPTTTMMCCLTTDPKAIGPTNERQKPSKHEPKKTLLSYKLIVLGFCYRELVNTPILMGICQRDTAVS
jgi:hypothetical protein